MAAVRALAQMGTVNAVEPLLDLLAAPTRGRRRGAINQAIAQIQSRLGAVDAGRLSSASTADASGALSVTGESGALSLGEVGA